jgi:DNA invertase Pin-like site-specific DNA recombinase
VASLTTEGRGIFNGSTESRAACAHCQHGRHLRRERQPEGIAKAKAAGVYKGRPASIDAARVRELKAQGMSPTAIAKALKIGRASVYRALQGESPRVWYSGVLSSRMGFIELLR